MRKAKFTGEVRPASLLSTPDSITPEIQSMALAIESVVNEKDRVTFFEIERDVEGFKIPVGGEGPYIGLGGPGFIWCATDTGHQAFKLLMHERRICIQSDRISNLVDAAYFINFMNDKCWMPVVLRPARYINFIAAASGLCFHWPTAKDIADCKRNEKRKGLTSINI